MTHDEILRDATARPWDQPQLIDLLMRIDARLENPKPAQGRTLADIAMIYTAVNSYESQRAVIGQLVEALERVHNNFGALLAGRPVRDASETIAETCAALAAAKKVRP